MSKRSDALRTEAARMLAATEREVLRARRRRCGLVAETFDGNTLVVVPDDHPDGAGRTGVMYRHRSPSPRHVLPVYTRRRLFGRAS